jgi:chloride channel 2
MVIGASVGRLIGELMGLGAVSYGAGVFAVVGAAGFCSAVTQSLSLIIIVFELTGQLFFLAPLIVTVVTAVLLSSRLGPSIYEQMVSQQPHLAQAFLPQIPRWASRGKVWLMLFSRIVSRASK